MRITRYTKFAFIRDTYNTNYTQTYTHTHNHSLTHALTLHTHTHTHACTHTYTHTCIATLMSLPPLLHWKTTCTQHCNSATKYCYNCLQPWIPSAKRRKLYLHLALVLLLALAPLFIQCHLIICKGLLKIILCNSSSDLTHNTSNYTFFFTFRTVAKRWKQDTDRWSHCIWWQFWNCQVHWVCSTHSRYRGWNWIFIKRAFRYQSLEVTMQLPEPEGTLHRHTHINTHSTFT